MSEDPRVTRARGRVTTAGRGVTGSCPTCVLGEVHASPTVFQLVANTGDKSRPEGTDVVVFICDRCGYMRLHAADDLE